MPSFVRASRERRVIISVVDGTYALQVRGGGGRCARSRAEVTASDKMKAAAIKAFGYIRQCSGDCPVLAPMCLGTSIRKASTAMKGQLRCARSSVVMVVRPQVDQGAERQLGDVLVKIFSSFPSLCKLLSRYSN